MKRLFIILFFIIQWNYAQTKLIAHKSHSGVNSTFHNAMKKHSELRFSNFGLPSMEYYEFDTLKYVSEKLAIGMCESRVDSFTHMFTEKNDLSYITFNLKSHRRWVRYNPKVVVQNYEIKNPIEYYKAKYTYRSRFHKTLIKLDTVERSNQGIIILKTNKKMYPLKGFEVFKIKELQEIKWLMGQLYDVEKTIFIGFKKPEKEQFRTIITRSTVLRDYYNSIHKLIISEDACKSKNKVEQQLDTVYEDILLKEELKQKDGGEFISDFSIDNKQPPFNSNFIYIMLIFTSALIGITYKIFKAS